MRTARRVRQLTRAYIPPASLLLLLVGLWEALVSLLDVEPYLLPAPSAVASAFGDSRAELPAHIRTTLSEAVLGLVAGAVVGVALASAIAMASLLRRVLYPVLVLSQNVPLIVLAPLLVVWFGFGMTPKVLVVALVGFFPVVVSTADGLLGADEEMVQLVRSMGGSRLRVLWLVRIPSALPGFFAGLKIGAAYAVGGAVIGEWVGASSGLGLFITRSQAAFRVDQVFVAVIVVTALSLALFASVHVLERIAMPWRSASNGKDVS